MLVLRRRPRESSPPRAWSTCPGRRTGPSCSAPAIDHRLLLAVKKSRGGRGTRPKVVCCACACFFCCVLCAMMCLCRCGVVSTINNLLEQSTYAEFLLNFFSSCTKKTEQKKSFFRECRFRGPLILGASSLLRGGSKYPGRGPSARLVRMRLLLRLRLRRRHDGGHAR